MTLLSNLRWVQGFLLPALTVLVLIATGCGLDYLPAPKPPQMVLPEGEPLKAGIAQVDITPPPGLGLFGHGPESRIATGVALRLRCQVFVLTGPRGASGSTESLVLIPCDLPAPSLALQRKIAEKVADLPLPASRIALMATHTHFGPGHFLPAGNFSGPFSGRRIGYDKEVVEFLAARIAQAVRDAYGARERARLAWGYTDVDGVSRNRSMTPLRLNRSLPTPIDDALHGGHARPEARAVDRRLSLLRIDLWSAALGTFVPAGAYAVFGVHPSVIGNRNSLYSGDLFGYATRHAASVLTQATGRTVLVGLANGLEGDVTSDRGDDTAWEARRLGHRLGDAIAALYASIDPSSMSEVGPLQVAYRELSWPGAEVAGGEPLCGFGSVGTVSAGGASDHPTSMRIFAAARPGAHIADGRKGRCDPFKFPLLEPDANPKPGSSFPAIAPVMLMRVGDGLLATAPAELTTVTGMRIAETVETARPAGFDGPVTMVGLTNEYLLYVATAEEYAAQYYEGAATVYGPRSAEFLRQQLGCIAGEMFAHAPSRSLCTADQGMAVDDHEKVPVPSGSASVLEGSDDTALGDPGTVQDLPGVSGGRVYRARFGGPFPGAIVPEEQVRVRIACGEQTLADDSGESLFLRYDDRAERRSWTAEWHAAEGDPCCSGQSAVFALTSQGQSLTIPFAMACHGGTP